MTTTMANRRTNNAAKRTVRAAQMLTLMLLSCLSPVALAFQVVPPISQCTATRDAVQYHRPTGCPALYSARASRGTSLRFDSEGKPKRRFRVICKPFAKGRELVRNLWSSTKQRTRQRKTDKLVREIVKERARESATVDGPTSVSIYSKAELDATLKQASEEGQLAVVFYHASWCRACHASLTRLRAMVKHRFGGLHLYIIDWQVDAKKKKVNDKEKNDFPSSLPHVRTYHPSKGLIDDRSAVKTGLSAWSILVKQLCSELSWEEPSN